MFIYQGVFSFGKKISPFDNLGGGEVMANRAIKCPGIYSDGNIPRKIPWNFKQGNKFNFIKIIYIFCIFQPGVKCTRKKKK